MTSRTTVTSLLVLFATSTIAAASCGDGSPSVPPPPKTTTSSVASSGGGETSAGGAGGTGGAGGSVTSTSSTGVGGASTTSTTSGTGGMTADPTCTDGLKNGLETDVDCGGITCGGCGPGLTCTMDIDCKGAACADNICKPTCTDGVKNIGTKETDVDCGGGTCPTCANNKGCLVNDDCTSNICNANKICVPASCMDGIQNLAETDIDCGGATCPVCSTGQKCSISTDCSSKSCASNKCACPSGMRIAPKVGGGTYCIDTTEVTNGQYDTFLSAGQAVQNLPAVCAYKLTTGYVPGSWPPPATDLSYPVSSVDWCDAYAYCAYSGKHLCGKIGGGQNVDPNNSVYADATQSEWYNACSAQGNNAYPYGNNYSGGLCTGVDGGDPAKPAGSCSASTCTALVETLKPAYAACQGGVVGLAGMSGGLAEWENSCDDAASPANCHVRGGSRCENGAAPGGALRCDELASKPIKYQDCDVGFRCCF